ncbi:hypothetical protein HUA78_23940 [Myxococcus sp. CA033]|uniref:hypothetical protein n=1 Tax=Myxococcus sp. CA033 TaxID=2741516 RepID=UPI00157B92A0|nr:hypothetical protein [Myxococcus sp. CA033]NTX37511.1 hypothetical protein [Myxococcus sp. CA033]
MKRLSLCVLTLTLGGCHLFRSRPQAPLAPPEVANSIQFPSWSKDGSTTVEGHQLKALQIALEDFLPPGTSPPKDADAMTRCLYTLDTYDAWLVRGERTTFVHFTPNEAERCGLKPEVMDPGASYAISDDGVILKRD